MSIHQVTEDDIQEMARRIVAEVNPIKVILFGSHRDLALVQNVGDNETIADEIVGFHVQQTVEKAIKNGGAST